MNQVPRAGDAGFGPGAQIGLGGAGRRGLLPRGRELRSVWTIWQICGWATRAVVDLARGVTTAKLQRRERGERRWRSHCCPQITTYEISARLVRMPMTEVEVLIWRMKSRKYALSWVFLSPGTRFEGEVEVFCVFYSGLSACKLRESLTFVFLQVIPSSLGRY